MPHQIKVTDELYERLKARAAGQPIPQLIRGLLDGEDLKEIKPDKTMDEGERLLEQLDKQHDEWQVDPLIKDLGPDELPECCQSIYDDPINHCEHWEDRRPVGYWNKLTHKWANDPDYIQYV